ncbi:MAG: flagellar basal-body MS-ring/collar protein FliF [Pseudomonadota bacterium]
MDGLTNFLRALGPARILAMGAVTAGLIGFFLFLSMRLAAPQMGILFTGLELSEASEITQRLEQMQVPYRLVDNGQTILAPNDRLLRLRMDFAGDGIGGTVGYELLDRQDPLGSTSFMQNIAHRRAIEGELARTISTINTVRDARVHLVLPERELFSRTQNKPSASVALRTRGGNLTQQQVQAIRYLVAASVPGLDPNRVSIIDQNGALLARSEDGAQTALVGTLHERQVAMEARLRDEVESLLAKTVGAGHVRAQVAVDLDFEQLRRESEIFDPDAQVVVSQNTVERASRDQERNGGTVSVATNLPDGQRPPEGPAQSSSSDETQETINYENSRTRTTLVKESGGIQRITVAVLVDGTYATAEDGTVAYTPRSEAELAQLERLVRNAIGFDEERGDTVEVVNLRFAQPAVAEEELPETSLMGLTRQDIERIVEIVVLGVVAILVLFLVVRPILKRVLEAIPQATASLGGMAEIPGERRPALAPPDKRQLTAELAQRAIEGDDDAIEILKEVRREQSGSSTPLALETEIDVAQVEGRLRGSAVKKVGEIVAKHPEESAAIIRQWLYTA